ncbi:MAG: hypothetical protein IKD62_02890 [Oscillospiraceae bacterium]|nr:hypothetical protein [Oscillospiraceae bacterium]
MTIEEILIAYLRQRDLPGIGSEVYAEKPVSPPDAYVTIQRTGGHAKDHLRHYTVHIDVFSKVSKLRAMQIHEELLSAMQEAPNYIQDVFQCALNSDYDASDVRTKEYRFQSLWLVTT